MKSLIAYSLYSKTGFPKTSGIAMRGMPYGLDENARLFKEIYLLTEFAKIGRRASVSGHIAASVVILIPRL